MKAMIAVLVFLYAGLLVNAQEPTIEFASSQYRTASGAIGPSGIVATHSFDIHLKSTKSLILEQINISGYTVSGRNMIIPPVLDSLIKLKLIVTIHQKQTVWYNATLTYQEITVPLDVIKKEEEVGYADVIFIVRSDAKRKFLVKDVFNSKTAVYNK